MEPSAARLRRAVAVTVAVQVVVFGGLALLFGALLEPGRDLENCSTGLYPGSYADAVVPAHLTAFAALALLAGWLSAQRSPSGRPDRLTLVALGLLARSRSRRPRRVGLPATLAGVWTNGAGLFCF